MPRRSEIKKGRDFPGGLIILFLCGLAVFSTSAIGQLRPSDVLILVNANSPTSRYIAKLYRQYHPEINESQVLYLSGLTDCSGPQSTPANEIITRQQYNDLIAGPVRNYLADSNYPGRITAIKIIITTAGMPYRIKDTVFDDAVYAAGSNYNTIINQEASIDAASVESELTCLWYCDYNVYDANFGRTNRMVNPYQGYHSSMSMFPRVPPGTKKFHFGTALSAVPTVQNPRMEGILLPPKPGTPPDFIQTCYYGTVNRRFHVGDMYLTARLDGPKATGQSAIFAVRAMLERAKRASNPQLGVNPAQAVAVFDDAPGRSENFDNNRTYNVNYGVEYLVYSDEVNIPPDADQCRVREDYINGYAMLTDSDPHEGILNIGAFPVSTGAVGVMLDRRNAVRTSQADLNDYAFANPGRANQQGVILLATFGKNGDEGNPPNYLSVGSPNNGPLFNVVNGAVFTSMESLNAVTMFSDVNTLPIAQGKVVDFISIGGTAAIGHSFEPQPDAAIDNEFLFFNLLADADGDGIADLTLVEAAFTAIPYLSWSEVLIGDPLMQIAYGPGQKKAWAPLLGDANNDGRVNFFDTWLIQGKIGGTLNTTNEAAFARYDDLCDINKDGRINMFDMWLAQGNMGAVADR
jgi:hypothetical protein